MATKKDRDKKKQRADKAKKQYNKNKGNRPKRTSKTAAGNKAEKAAYAKQKVQDAATARKKAGVTVKDTIAANRQAVKDFATNQHAKFKQTGVQTQGGTRSSDSYSTREKKAITDAGYNTKSYGTDKARSDTDVQVSRDNARYGDTFPAGAFSPTKPAYSQAEQPRFKEGQLVAGDYTSPTVKNYGLRPDGEHGYYKTGDVFNTGGLKGKDFMYDGKTWKQVQNLPGQEVGTFAAADLSGMQIGSMPTQQVPTRTYGYPSQQEVDDAVAQGTAGFIPSGSLNINKPTTEETGNALSRALQIGNFDLKELGKEVMGDPLGYAKTVGGFLSDIASQAFSPSLADGTLRGNMDLAGRLPGDAGFNQQDVNTKAAVNAALNSEGVNQLGQMKGLPSDFQAQTRDALSALDDNFRGATADRDGVYSGVSETLRTLNQDPRLKPVAKFLGQLGTDNETLSDAERNQNFKIAGFTTPFSNETAADIVSSFQPNTAAMRELSKEERGRLVGGIGNRLVSGKFTDAAREALTGYGGAGENLGLQRGTPLSIANTIDAGRMMMKNFNTEGTLANRRFTEIGNLADPSGRITTPSLIRGTLGIGRSRGSSGGAFGRGFLSRLPNATTTPQEVVEFIQDTLPSEVIPEFTDPTDAYNESLNQYLTNPNYFPQVQQYTPPVRTSFKQTFNRNCY